jgi:hypothetical protein
MTGYDFDRPFVSQDALRHYEAVDATAAARYGPVVKATELSNLEYRTRFVRMARENNMKPPPDGGRIFPGYLVVRKLGAPDQYETWIPDEAFEEMYQPQREPGR